MSLINEITSRLHALVVTRRRDDHGASLVEYALLLALIAAVCILAVTFLGSETSDSFSRSTNSFANS